MKKFLLLSAASVAGVAVLTSGVAEADTATVTYSSCITTSNNLAFDTLEVRVDRYSKGYTDSNGCFSVALTPNETHDITLIGLQSFDPIVPITNGFRYIFDYRIDNITADTHVDRVIPITDVRLNTVGIDGAQINGAALELSGTMDLSGVGPEDIHVTIRSQDNQMIGGDGYIQLGMITGMNSTFKIHTDPALGYETYDSGYFEPLNITSAAPMTFTAVLNRPAPAPINDLTYSIDQTTGHAQLHWSASQDATTINVYAYDNSGPVRIAQLPASSTGFDLGILPQQGIYSYAVRTANQYGYEGNGAVGTSIAYDYTAPTLDHYEITASRPAGDASYFYLRYSDHETMLSKVEYFIDNDPGEDNGIVLSQTDENNYIIEGIGQDLSPGTYTIGVRGLDIAGNWSAVSYQTIEVTPVPEPTPEPEQPPVDEPTEE